MSGRLKICKKAKKIFSSNGWLQCKISPIPHESSLNINFSSNVWQFKEETRLCIYNYVKTSGEKNKDEEQFRQVVCEHFGIVGRQQMRLTFAKYLGGTGHYCCCFFQVYTASSVM